MPGTHDPSMLPIKRLDEDHQSFLDRCMSDPNMMTTYPEPAQRAALCMSQAGMKPKVGGNREHDAAEEAPHEIRLSGSVTITQD